jgi:hypothetical protein
MKFPYKVKEKLSAEEMDVWKNVYCDSFSDWDRKSEESIWRRTQSTSKNDLLNKDFLGGRKRMVHYNYKYDLFCDAVPGEYSIYLKDFYLWIYYTLPLEEDLFKMIDFVKKVDSAGWKLINKNNNNRIYTKENLFLHAEKSPADADGYFNYEVYLSSPDFNRNREIKEKPWNILKTGVRECGKRSDNFIAYSGELLRDLLPAQVELGCGPSTESGIPPLHFLHDVYSVTKDFKTKKFILNPSDDVLLGKVLFNTEEYFPVLTKMFRTAFEKRPGIFYQTLKKMYDKGYFVGEVINNNFDLMPSKVGLKEKFIRRFEETHIAPKFTFHPQAKSLFVFGLHADRRKTQEAARKRGLKIVYIDTEGFTVDGTFYPYPLENLCAEDYLYKEEAGIAICNMYNLLNNKKI